MWALALVRRNSKIPERTAKRKLSRSRVKPTRVEMVETKEKKRSRSKLSQTLIGQISANHQRPKK